VDDLVSGWKAEYGVSRIDLNDCLTSAQASWIAVAVGVPLVTIHIH
jgi:hypothetical protein